MPNYLKRGLWLRGVARRLEDEVLAALLESHADRMIHRSDPGATFNDLRNMKPE